MSLTQSNLDSLLKYSMLAHLVWNSRVTAIAKAAYEIREQLEEETVEGLNYQNLTPQGLTFQEWGDEYVRRSEDIIRITLAVGEIFSVPVFHVIQPNQYLKGPKVLTIEGEKRNRDA